MHDGRTRLARDVEREVREHFPQLVFDTVIPRNVRIGEAPSFGRPVIHHDPHCAGSDAYFELAKEVAALREREPHERRGRAIERRTARHGDGGLAAILAVTDEPATRTAICGTSRVELIAPEPAPAAPPLRRGGAAGARRLAARARRRCSRCSCGRSPAGATSWSPASAAGAPRRSRASSRSPRSCAARDDGAGARARAHREHGPRGPQPGRGGARLRGARRGARPHARGGRPAGRAQPRRRLEPHAPARPARRGARAARGRASSARATAARCCSPRTTATARAPGARGRARGLVGARDRGEGARGQRAGDGPRRRARKGAGRHPDQAAAASRGRRGARARPRRRGPGAADAQPAATARS